MSSNICKFCGESIRRNGIQCLKCRKMQNEEIPKNKVRNKTIDIFNLRLDSLEEMEGKTIKEITYCYNQKVALLIFTDKTWITIGSEVERDYGCCCECSTSYITHSSDIFKSFSSIDEEKEQLKELNLW